MFRVFECVLTQHDLFVVGLAAAIWIVGSLAFFLALARAQECRWERRASWLAIGGFAGGLGVWATHFVAMLAYDGVLPIGYAFFPTLISAAAAILGFWTALRLLGQASAARCALAGIIAACSVGVMHFIGMAAIRAQAHISYDWNAVAISLALAMSLFATAFYIFGHLMGGRRFFPAVSASVLAVCALHFTSMSATTLKFDPTLAAVHATTGREWLIGAIVASTMVVVILTAAATLIDRYLTDLKGFAGATLEGILIVRDHKIVEGNERFAEWMNSSPSDLVGLDPESLLAAQDGRPIIEERHKAVEAVRRGGDAEQLFEVGVHEIEYRGRLSQCLRRN